MSEILVGQFLIRRLKQLGIKTIFGVPGDFELAFLDLVEREDDIEWRGTPNELVGSYAADGYARVNGIAAVVTTFGPGELSALCGLGGACCEYVPVLHIVGYPTISAQKSGKILHHTLGDGSYDHYIKISSELSCATAVLKDSHNAAAEIDRVLEAMIYHSQTGYIGISEDVAYAKVPASLLEKDLNVNPFTIHAAVEETAVAAIVEKLKTAKTPIVVVDGGAARTSWAPLAGPLLEALGLPFFTTVLGKGIVNEESPLFGGVYAGHGSLAHAIKAIKDSDCILWLGNYPSDFNTGMFTVEVHNTAVIDFQRHFVKIRDTKYDAPILNLLPKLTEAVRGNSFTKLELSIPAKAKPSVPETIAQDWLWERLSDYVQPSDLIIVETGTAQFGIASTAYKKGTHGWTQGVYGSIGYAAGSAVGASIAAKELGKYKRLVLVTGEGSLQLTVQSFSLLNRFGITPVVFVLNNSGYTVERYFCGMTAKYNDVPFWDYSALFKAFAPDVPTKGYHVKTGAELDALLSDPEFTSATVPQIVDMVMGQEDCPALLKGVFAEKYEKAKA